MHVFSFSTVSLLVIIHTVTSEVADKQESHQPRALNEDLSFCYGESSICAISNDLFGQCTDFQKDFKNLNPWYSCICGNGYVTANEACHWCDWGYGLTDSSTAADAIINLKNDCISAGVSIAPLPTKAVALLSSFNATYTGNPETATATYTGRPATGTVGLAAVLTSISDKSSVAKTTSKLGSTVVTESGSTATKPALTHNGGSTFVQTLFGGGSPTQTGLGSENTLTLPSTSVNSGNSTSDSSILGAATSLMVWAAGLCLGVYVLKL